ncbi:hypothetical protein GVAV_003412 [Gurleya vavrai]
MKNISSRMLYIYTILFLIPNIYYPISSTFSIYKDLHTAFSRTIMVIFIFLYSAYSLFCILNKNKQRNNLKSAGLLIFSILMLFITIFKPARVTKEEKDEIVRRNVEKLNLI